MRYIKYFTTILFSLIMILSSCKKERPDKSEEPEIPEIIEVIESATMTFSYYDIVGIIDAEEQRIDFNMDVYATDDLDLRYLTLTFGLKNDYTIQNLTNNVINNATLNVKKPTDVTFVKDTSVVVYQIYVNPTVKQAERTEFYMKAGVNLSYWFQEEHPWPQHKVLEEVKAYGFDHVRFPVDSFVIIDEEGNIKPQIMTMVHGVIEKCLDLGLNVIFDLHWLRNGNTFYKQKAAEELSNCWIKLMPELSKYSNEHLAYEVLNEPFGTGWDLMLRRMIHLIRHYEPERVIFVSPSGYSPEPCGNFYLPPGDPNLVMTFHYYEPMLASHRYQWGYTGPSHYPGLLFSEEEWNAMTDAEREIAQWHKNKVYDYEYTLHKFNIVKNSGQRNKCRIHCGEYGMSMHNIRSERLQWFRDIVRAFAEYDIPHTVWENWGGDFGPGSHHGAPDEEVINILLEKE